MFHGRIVTAICDTLIVKSSALLLRQPFDDDYPVVRSICGGHTPHLASRLNQNSRPYPVNYWTYLPNWELPD